MNAFHIEPMERRRLMAGYAPDVSFANDGLLPTGDDEQFSRPATTLLRSDNNGLLVATLTDGQQAHLRLLRYTQAGQIDSTFAPRDLPYRQDTLDYAYADRQGRVLVLSHNDADRTVQVSRYTTAGVLDTGFGRGGSVALPVGRRFYAYARDSFDLTTAADGSIYVAAITREGSTGPDVRSLYKLTATGQVDSNFGSRGIVKVGNTYGFSFTADAQSRVLVGFGLATNQYRFSRYLANGQIDPSYGTKGSFDSPPSNPLISIQYSAAFDSQGRALLLTSSAKSTLTRLTTSGRLDDTFDKDGVAVLPDYGNSLVAQSDGRIGLLLNRGGDALYFTRLRSDGRVDTTFGENGVAEYRQTNRPAELSFNQIEQPYLLAQAPDGNYLLAVGAKNGRTVEKVAPAQAARRGASGKLYLLGESGSDRVTVTQPTANLTRVVFNGQTYDFTKRIKGVYANLAGGNNRLYSPVNVPQEIAVGRNSDTITTGDAPDTILASEGDDLITTAGGYDRINFRGGNKTIDAGGGSGLITGGGGGNRAGSGKLGEVRITGAGTDGATEGGWNVDVRGTRVSVSVAGGSARLKVYASLNALITPTVTGRVSTAIDSKRVTYLARQAATRGTVFASVESYIQLGDDDDVLTAGRGNDTLLGAGGNDRLYGSGGDDEILGGAGDDTLVGGEGNDRLSGERGNDRLYAGTPGQAVARRPQNFLQGGPGDDVLFREGANDRLV